MKRDNYNKFDKNAEFKKNVNSDFKKDDVAYSYYSRVLKEPFDSIEELKEAEQAYYARLRAKEDKAAKKKADAKKVEDAFVALNAARKSYKEDLTALTAEHSKKLLALNEAFKATQAEIKAAMAKAEDDYVAAIKEFTEKYPEGYHLTLKDGDFETTISGSHSKQITSDKAANVADIFSWLLGV